MTCSWKMLAVIAVAGAALMAGVGYAAIPGSDGTINACFKTGSGALRVLDAETGRTCTKYEAAIEWNQVGPQGEPGPQGARGVTNIAEVYSRVASVHTPPDTVGSPMASCLPGDQVISGGYYVQGPQENVQLQASYPQMPEDAWQVRALNKNTETVDVVSAVVCLDLP